MDTANIKFSQQLDSSLSSVIIIDDLSNLKSATSEFLSDSELNYVQSKKEEDYPVFINQYDNHCVVSLRSSKEVSHQKSEKNRISGYEICNYSKTHKIETIQIIANGGDELEIAEGLILANYDFTKYKTQDHKEYCISLVIAGGNKDDVEELKNNTDAVFFARNIVNEPQSYLTATQLSSELKEQCDLAGVEFTMFDFKKIKELKMGGLLAVNQGSIAPPTFNILEYKPTDAKNSKTIIFVGKGVVYDTGGLSLKPTPQSMDIMKCDMGGSATVAGAILAIAKNKLPYHVITLIPATDNRPGGDAYAPGDVLTMYNGSTVEVWNTDAEGRLVLADALTYAEQYNPELVIDVATLTGAAMRALGKEATALMGTASEETKSKLKSSGNNVYERLVEFPLWDEYADSLKSDIADIKNLGEANSGHITAAKFLQTFTTSPWMHLDIAGPAFLSGTDKYRGKNATGVGVRLLYDFVKSLASE